MASGKLPHALTLKEFFLRRQVLTLYRQILRTLREVPNEDHKKELADWARAEFKKNKEEKDEIVIKMMLSQGRLTLQEISSAINLAK
ncbi:LYR motif-containing protein 2 [Acropora cervicornis]|uniref:LYR motif-containing protein 2 n=1 Tax=Acropora cervicornis TaxID=6130 RepID=A0AAD9PWA7_ACRCE|nr:PREDICTED: LYR motif-containing protein 2-like [Acropora digitifera]XP_029214046.1 LYR motif-containing protein 2-like [Acropora millepora]KAK2550259.1 LYR motif-containing protein 2 [Acropora cervicornis]